MKTWDEVFNSKVGIFFLVYIVSIFLERPDVFLFEFWLLICLSFFLLLAGVAKQRSEIRKSFFPGFPENSLISKWDVVHVFLVICVAAAVSFIGFRLESLLWLMAALSVLTGIGAGVNMVGLKVFTVFDFEEGLMRLPFAGYELRISPGFDFGIIFLSGMICCCKGSHILDGFLLVMPVCFLLTLFIRSSAKQIELKPFSKKLTPNFVKYHQPQLWMSGLMFFLSKGAEISSRTRVNSFLAGYRGVDPMPAGLFTCSYFRFVPESLPNFI